MATRKQKHARAVAKREKFLEELHFDNTKWLKKAQTDRIEQQKAAEASALERKKAKSKRLAEAHRSRPQAPGKITPATARVRQSRRTA